MRAFSRNPFFLPLLAVLAGMSGEAMLPGEPESYWPGLVFSAVLGLAALLLRGEYRAAARRWFLPGTLFFAGGFWLSLHPLAEAPPANAAPGEAVVAEGCVDSAVIHTAERLQFVLRTEEGARLQVSLYPREGEAAPALRYGQQVEVEGRVRPPRNFRNPGSFDYERYLARQNVYWLLFATGASRLRIRGDGCGSAGTALLHGFRESLIRRIRARFAEQPEARAWLSAMLLGDDSLLPEETLQQYRVAGVYHVLVISGQHIAILAGALLLALRLVAIPRWLRFLLTASACWAYAFVAGQEVPAMRAAFGLTLYLAGSLPFRRARPLNLLSVIALLFLAWDPGQLLDTSFQLSFLAVLAIAGIAAPLQRALFGNWTTAAQELSDPGKDLRLPPRVAEARVELRQFAATLSLATRMPERICVRFVAALVYVAGAIGSLLLISVAVQAVLTPLLVHDFHRAPLVAPLTNLLLSPMLGLVIPFAFLDLLLPIPGAEIVLGAAVRTTNWLVSTVASSAPDLRIPDVPPVLLALATLCICAAILLWEPLARRPSAQERRGLLLAGDATAGPWRSWRSVLVVGVLAGLLGLIVIHPFAPQAGDGTLEISMLDVGQGDATLVVAPGGETMLIDTGGLGGFSSTSRLDTGEDLIAPYLWQRGIRRMDVLVLSHFDYDHAGGSPAILRIFRPKELWLAEIPGEHALWPAVRAAAEESGAQVRLRRRGDTGSLGAIQWRVLHPGSLVQAADRPSRSNDASLVLHLRYGSASALFPGDVHRAGELEMLGGAEIPHADVLKVAHHGSRTSSSALFLDAISPSVALVSAGFLNPYRHPSTEVVRRLQDRGTALFRTDRDGAIFLRTDGRRWWHHQP